MDDTDIRPAEGEGLVGAEPTKPEEKISNGNPGNEEAGEGRWGLRPVVVAGRVKGADMAVKKGLARGRRVAKATLQASSKVVERSVGLRKRGAETAFFGEGAEKKIRRGGKEKREGVVPTGSAAELTDGGKGHAGAVVTLAGAKTVREGGPGKGDGGRGGGC